MENHGQFLLGNRGSDGGGVGVGGGNDDKQRRVDGGIGNIHCTGQTCLKERESSYSRYKESQWLITVQQDGTWQNHLWLRPASYMN